MKITLQWLREFVPVDIDLAALTHILSVGGLEVDGVEELGQDLRGVWVAEIVAMRPHPNADRLTVCELRTHDATVAVVCGARNMKPGDRVALAVPGTILPGGKKIEASEIRGVASAGMLCSEVELGLANSSEGIFILASDASVGSPLATALGRDGTVLDISITPNRGDCLSVLGVAREVAALTGVKLRSSAMRLKEKGRAAADEIAVRIDAPDLCARYAARVVRNVTIAPSPAWIQDRLRATGMRPINNVVDVTNYVMIELGQPLHAFDLQRLVRSEVVVRRAGTTRSIRTLDDQERLLEADDLLITTGDAPIAIAGVMGGLDSEVCDATRTILLESAWFNPASVRRTKKRLDLNSEAAYRFERGTDPEGVLRALDRAAELLQQVCGGDIAPGVVDVFPGNEPRAAIELRRSRIERILGLPVPPAQIRNAMKRIGARVETAGKAMRVVPPSWRSDLEREIDLIEEVARILTYEAIPTRLPAAPMVSSQVPDRMRFGRRVSDLLTALGLTESLTVSFASSRMNHLFPGDAEFDPAVRVINPMVQEESEMRRSLLPGLLATVRVNRNQGAAGVPLFSIGKVFGGGDKAREGWRLAFVLVGRVGAAGLAQARDYDFSDAKGIVEAIFSLLRLDGESAWLRDETARAFHPGKTAEIRLGETPVGRLGALHPEVEAELELSGANWLCELDLEKLLSYEGAPRVYEELPRFPAVIRDLAVIVSKDSSADAIPRFVRSRANPLIEQVTLFDEYVGAPIPSDKKSLAYSIAYRSRERTLTDEEVNRLHEEVVGAITATFQIEMRA